MAIKGTLSRVATIGGRVAGTTNVRAKQVYSVEDEEKKGQISRHLRYKATWLKAVCFRSDVHPRWSVMPSQSLTEEFCFLLKCPGIVLKFGWLANNIPSKVNTL